MAPRMIIGEQPHWWKPVKETSKANTHLKIRTFQGEQNKSVYIQENWLNRSKCIKILLLWSYSNLPSLHTNHSVLQAGMHQEGGALSPSGPYPELLRTEGGCSSPPSPQPQALQKLLSRWGCPRTENPFQCPLSSHIWAGTPLPHSQMARAELPGVLACLSWDGRYTLERKPRRSKLTPLSWAEFTKQQCHS